MQSTVRCLLSQIVKKEWVQARKYGIFYISESSARRPRRTFPQHPHIATYSTGSVRSFGAATGQLGEGKRVAELVARYDQLARANS